VGFDPNAQAATGIMASKGGLGLPRVVPTHMINDYLTGYLGAGAVVAALIRRVRGGSHGIELSLARTAMWVQDLGLVPTGSDHRPSDYAPRVVTMDSPFGKLRYLMPATRYSETPGYWDCPPVPLGSCAPAWLSDF
jgi:hypothetical protein